MLQKLKSRKLPVIVISIILVLVIIAGLIFFVFRGAANPAGAESAIMTASAVKSSIVNTVTGTGNLAGEDAQDIKIPTGITIDEVLVESGDTVSMGDALATVDKSSVLSKISEVQNSIASIDDEIEDAKDSASTTETVTSGVSGRVKKIYAASGDSVSSVMSSNGAIMLLSVDGLMAVDIETTAVSQGDSVTVTLSDGSTVTGTVKSVSSTTAIITMTDNGTALDDSVTVSDSSGNNLGTGNLYISSPLSVTASSGTVSSISVSENSSISSGSKLFTLKDISTEASYAGLIKEREDYVEALQQLITLSETGTVYADFNGTVASVNIESGDTTGASSSTTSSSTSTSASSTTQGSYSSGFINTASTGANISLLSAVTSTTDSNEESSFETIEIPEQISNLNTLSIEAPLVGAAPQTLIESTNSTNLDYSGKIAWYNGSTELGEGDVFINSTIYKASVTLTANDGYVFSNSIKENIKVEGIDAGDIVLSNDVKTLSFTLTYPKTADNENEITEEQESGDAIASGISGSSGIGSIAGSSSGSAASGSYSISSGSTGSISGGTASSTASGSSLTDSTSAAESSVETASILSVTPNDSMVITVNIDELDIMSLAVGQEATVTLDAVENESFSGEISSVNTSATSSGGVTKYSVDVKIPKTDEMLAGMTASITIVIEKQTDILVVPVDAVQETRDRIYVYTEQDDEGNLSGEVEVETGISDGSFVEITSGLAEGDTVYYQLSVSDDSFANATGNFSFGMGGNMGDSGSMPSFDRDSGGTMGGGNGGPPSGN